MSKRKVIKMPRKPAHARATVSAHAGFLAGELEEVVERLRRVEADPDCVSLTLFRSISEPLRHAHKFAVPELMEDVQALAQALRRSTPPPEAA
ncbi:MAG: hypothetical protein MEQ07_09240 [Aquimonas sp.]|nr:hypothetical protein [Aquimonas sp.]